MTRLSDEREVDGVTEELETHYAAPSEKDSRWMLDYTYLFWELTARLYGGYLLQDKHGQYRIKYRSDAMLLNKRGINGTISFLNGFVTKIGATSYFEDENRILNRCRDLHIKLAHHYYDHMDDYDLTPSKASLIIDMILSAIEDNLRKSIRAKMMQTLGGPEEVRRIITQPSSQGQL